MLTEIKIGGLGGQGVILGGIIIGKAAALFDNKFSTLTQAFGPEARGSACSAQVVVDDSPILYPYVHRPHLLVTLSQDAFAKFGPELREDGMLLYEQDLVSRPACPRASRPSACRPTAWPRSWAARCLNIVMVGFFTGVTQLRQRGPRPQGRRRLGPPITIDLNTQAFDKGLEFGKRLRAEKM
jgi:2-oxoglutarate ferredoxin oxidoreductase subunit gamma